VACKLENCEISNRFFGLVLRLKKMEVLSLFSFCPDVASYLSSSLVNLLHSTKFALQKIKLSYAKNRWLNLGPFLDVGIRNHPFFFSTLVKRALRASAHKRNRYGDKGSPCRILLVGLIFPLGCPLTRMA
jgi:hypothetical protein